MLRSTIARLGIVTACLTLTAWVAPQRARGDDRVVTKTADTNDGVCAPDDCSLREALDVANAGDTIIIPAGTYTLGGELVIDTSVTLQGAGARATIIQAAVVPGVAGYRVFNVTAASADVALLDLTVRHGAIIGSGGGGALSWPAGTGSLTITRCEVVFNQVNADGAVNGGAASGGALVIGSASLTITDSTIADNQATANGGTGNGGAVSGGAIFSGVTTIERSTVARNRIMADSPSGFGGAVSGGALFSGPTTIVRSTVANNSATANGGRAGGAGSGGALFVSGGLTLTDSTVSGNALSGSAVSGGAIFASPVQASSSTIVDSHLSGTAASGGGVFGTVHARNTILANNAPTNCSSLLSDGYNLIDVDTCSITPAAGDQIGTASMPIDPRLGPLGDNGGPTFTHALLAGSPAIDGGNPGGCVDENGMPILVDQRGVPRNIDGNGDGIAVCDTGAYEFRGQRQAPVLDRLALVVLAAALLLLATRRLPRPRRNHAG